MALKRLTIDGNGQIELNNVAFRRDGRIEAQCALDTTDFASVKGENGMILAVDKTHGTVRLPDASETCPLAINYTSEHIYDERTPGLKNFSMKGGDYARMGYLSVGDIFTTNCVAYDSATDAAFANESAVISALDAAGTTAVYGAQSTSGAILLTATAPTSGLVLNVVKKTTMPDGQLGVKFQVARV